MSARGADDIQKQIQRDWANREYIEVMTSSIKKITDFLNGFDLSCRSRLASLNEKLTNLERRMEYVEALVTVQETATEWYDITNIPVEIFLSQRMQWEIFLYWD